MPSIHRSLATGGALVAATAVAMGPVTPASAMTSTPLNVSEQRASTSPAGLGNENGNRQVSVGQYTATGLSRSVIAKYDKYVRKSSHGYVASIPRNVAKAYPREAAAVRAAVKQANSRPSATHRMRLDDLEPGTGNGGGQTPHGGFSTHWWGYKVWMNGAMTNRVISNVAVGVSVVGLLEAAGLPDWVAVHVAQGVAATGAAFLARCSGSDGVILRFYGGLVPTCTKRY